LPVIREIIPTKMYNVRVKSGITVTILSVIREITPTKTYNIRVKSGMCQRPILINLQ
jgi:hypothetical protein